jgi:hypothetical protein
MSADWLANPASPVDIHSKSAFVVGAISSFGNLAKPQFPASVACSLPAAASITPHQLESYFETALMTLIATISRCLVASAGRHALAGRIAPRAAAASVDRTPPGNLGRSK